MSTPRHLTVERSVVRADTETDRGRFAVWTCEPLNRPLPHGRVVLVPGFTGSKEDFGALLPLLAESGWSALTYDQRGQYESPAAASDDLTLDGFAADLVAVIDAVFGADERVHLVGHSFGGLVARSAVLAEPKRWASLTLLCSGPGAFSGAERDQLRRAADLILADGLEAAYHASRQRNRDRGLPEPPPDIEQFLHERFVTNSPASLASMARLIAEAPDVTAELAALDLGVAVMRGEHDDAWPHDVQSTMAEQLGTAVVVIADAAHSPAVEQPEETRDALARVFLGR